MKHILILAVILMTLFGVLCGCGSDTDVKNGISEAAETTNSVSDTTYNSQYDITADTYVSTYKYMITLPTINKGTSCAEICGGTKDFYSVVAVQGIGEDDAKLYDIDLSKDYTDDEIIEAVYPSVYMMLGDLHDVKDNYRFIMIDEDAAEFKYDSISSVEIGEYSFTKATGQIVVKPMESEQELEPYSMNMVLYARKLNSGNLFYYFEYNDCNISVLGVDEPIVLTIEDLEKNAEDNLLTFREYKGDISD